MVDQTNIIDQRIYDKYRNCRLLHSMKIVLIQPPSGNSSLKVPPLGLAYITSMLKRNHIEAKIVDLSAENSSLSTYLSREKPEVIGISSIVTNARRALEIAKRSKNILPRSFVVMGGSLPEHDKRPPINGTQGGGCRCGGRGGIHLS